MANPAGETLRVARAIKINRAGLDKTQFYFSFTGGIILAGEVQPISMNWNGHRLDVEAPKRIASPSFRPTPHFDFQSIQNFFQVEIPTPFPIQAGTFPGANTDAGATANCWFGPSDELPEGSPCPPPDTLLVTLFGSDSANEGAEIERRIIRPLVEWLRVETGQWWIGRSTEGVNGALHFIAPLDQQNALLGSPTPVIRMTTAGPNMTPLTNAAWIRAWELVGNGDLPAAARTLEMDANFAIASQEFRIGIILACAAIEAARDSVISQAGFKLSDMKTSSTDLLKHLSVGFEKLFRRNLRDDDPNLFQVATAFWSARGEAAHGKSVRWRIDQLDIPIEDVEFDVVSDNLSRILQWIDSLTLQIAK